jgi:hypothetical protein
MRNDSDKDIEKIKVNILCSKNCSFFGNIVGNYGTARQATKDIMLGRKDSICLTDI